MDEQNTQPKDSGTLPIRRAFWRVGLGCLIVGAVLLVIGFILYDKADVKQYTQRIYVNESFSADCITALEIDLDCDNLTIEKADDDNITLVGENVPAKAYEWSADTDSFTLKSIDYKWYEWYKSDKSFLGSDDIAEFTLYLPEKDYDKFTLDAGVGDVKINGVSIEEAEISLGVGDCAITDTRFGKLTADCGVGELNFSGELVGSLDLSAGVGDVVLNIDGCYSDYDIDYDTGIGDVKINKGSNENPVGTSIPMIIDAGVGDIEITFK